jgi:CheY-like chemotaxis protein
MDLQMPEMDGLTATVVIRQKIKPSEQPAIIAITANTERERCLEAGMNDYLSKPVRIEELASALNRLHTSPNNWSSGNPPQKCPKAQQKASFKGNPLSK